MKINPLMSVTSQGFGVNKQLSTDNVSKNIQSQIANAQKQLQELSSNKDMGIEEKMKKREEIQQQITNLNNQLKQHELEQQKEKHKSNQTNNMLYNSNSYHRSQDSSAFTPSNMISILSANSTIEQTKIQQNVATKMEGKANILKAEIKQDIRNGGNAEAKKEQLAKIEQKTAELKNTSLNTLTNAQEQLNENIKTEQQIKEREININPNKQEDTEKDNN